MRSLGIDLKKEEIRWCMLTGSLARPSYMSHGRKKYSILKERPAMMRVFHNLITEIISESRPEIIGYRVTQSARTVEQLVYLIMPFGILGLTCGGMAIPTKEFNNMTFTAKKFELPKGTNPEAHLLATIGSHSPHWDQNAAMSAWLAIDG